MIAILFFFLAGLANAAMDVIKFNGHEFLFQDDWWLERGSWAPKLRSWLQKHITYFISGGWHLMKFIMVGLFILAGTVYESVFTWWVDVLLLFASFSGAFILGFYWIWRKK